MAEPAVWDASSACLVSCLFTTLLPKQLQHPRGFAKQLCKTLRALDWPELPTMAAATMGVGLGAICRKLDMAIKEVWGCWVIKGAIWRVIRWYLFHAETAYHLAKK